MQPTEINCTELSDDAKCLSDNVIVINTAQQLLRNWRINVKGLYDTILVAASNVQRHNDDVGNTVQIVFNFVHEH
jgi:hypothetical protein